MNKVILMGVLGATPELRMTSGGVAVCNLRLATNRRVNKGGKWVQETDWHDVRCWGASAEAAANHLEKGHKVLVEGELRTNDYVDKNGNKQRSTVVQATSPITFLTPKSKPENQRPPAPDTNEDPFAADGPTNHQPESNTSASEEEVPF